MTNAEFYNKIKKQAAHMESSYPELSQHITSQSPSNKKNIARKKQKAYYSNESQRRTEKTFLKSINDC